MSGLLATQYYSQFHVKPILLHLNEVYHVITESVDTTGF